MTVRHLLALTTAAAILATTIPADPEKKWQAATAPDRQAYDLNVREGDALQKKHEQLRGRPEYELARYQRAPMCNVSSQHLTTPLNGECPPAEGRVGTNDCGEDTTLEPLWVQRRATEADPWSAWRNVDLGGCGADILPVMTQEDFRRLPIPAPVLTMQPDRGWVLINKATIVLTDPTPVTLRTDLLGHGVTVQATPVHWTYDFGDGHTLDTTSPGHPYPDHDVFHTYTQPALGTTITLTAEWTGRYQIDGNPTWRDINGYATTTATSTPFDIEERTSRLVSGLCTDRPKPPDC